MGLETNNLPVEQKLLLVERLWDEIGDEAAPIPLPAWATDEARRRLAELKADPHLGLSEDEAWRRLNGRRG